MKRALKKTGQEAAMLRFEAAKDNLITNVVFGKPVEPWKGSSTFGARDHEILAKQLDAQAGAFASVIVTVQDLHKSLWNDPHQMHKTNHILCSVVEEEARQRMQNRYADDAERVRLFKKYELPDWQDNFSDQTGEANRKFRTSLEDAIFKAQEDQLYPEIIEEFRESCRWDYNEETDEEKERSKEEFKKAWAEERERIFMPRVRTEYERVYHMPEPFCHWDDRNIFQQWYFVQYDNRILYAQGGSGSSGQREQHGRFAHIFAVLSSQYHKNIATFVLVYDEFNQLRFIWKSDKFKAVDRELTGNYPGRYEEIDRLFKDALVSVDSKTGKINEPSKSGARLDYSYPLSIE